MSERQTILFVSNTAWNLANFRRPLIEAFVARGDKVICAASPDAHERSLLVLGAEFEPLAVDAGGTSPIADGRLLLSLVAFIRRLRPDTVFSFTIKPNIYAAIAARRCGVRVIPTVSGLGSSFLGGGLTAAITNRLYRQALRPLDTVMFQNGDDRDLFVVRGLVDPSAPVLVRGSGIDLDRFRAPATPPPAPFRFLLIARLLRDKGLTEYAEAARRLRSENVDARLQLLGPDGGTNPSAVPMALVERWVADGTIDYLGSTDDVRPAIAGARCIVLPSYREGLPRSLLEGAAMSRPLIATDVPGCRDLVSDGINGLLCAPRSADDLARAMNAMLAASDRERAAMGAAGRKLVEEQYDQRLVADAYLREAHQ